MNLGTATVIRGNARRLPLADNTVDLVVTSPPYFALRSYQDGGEHYAGQIGDEPTPAEFVDSLIEVTRELIRVTKPSGSIWINLGDKYTGSGMGGNTSLANSENYLTQRANGYHPCASAETESAETVATPTATTSTKDSAKTASRKTRNKPLPGLPPSKSLIGIPWRYALRCIDDLGLILRAEVIWSKSNGLPESVQDRVRRSHEQWFCFEQSGGVEASTQSFPFCPLCGRPVDARATLIQRLKESNGGVVPLDLADQVRSEQSVQRDGTSGADLDHGRVSGGPSVAPLVERDVAVGEDSAQLLEDGVVAVVEHDPQVGVPVGSAGESDGSLAVEDAGEPAEVCDCVGHPFILNDEPWLPQSLAAEIMQRVADGEIDPQQAADFLSGDYVRNHSVWFHFTLGPRYFSAVDEIREPHAGEFLGSGVRNPRFGRPGGLMPKELRGELIGNGNPHRKDQGTLNEFNPLGKLPGSVWTIPTEPLQVPASLGVDHFAAFPTEWPRRIIMGWSPSGVCTGCGEGRRPVAVSERTSREALRPGYGAGNHGTGGSTLGPRGVVATITGYACGCAAPTIPVEVTEFDYETEETVTRVVDRPDPSWVNPAPTTPAVILDPFGGTGTTALVAKALGRHGITIDMSADYGRLAKWRTNDLDQLAKVQGIRRSDQARAADGLDMDTLFDFDGGAA